MFGLAFVAAVVRTRLAARRHLPGGGVQRSGRDAVHHVRPHHAAASSRRASLAGALLAFTLSIDEFVIAFFTARAQPTLPMVIYSMVRFGVTPEINALATLLLAVSFTVVIAAQRDDPD